MEETKVVDNKSEQTKSSSVKKSKKSDNVIVAKIKGLFSKIGGFFAGVKAEFAKIIWPTKDDVIKQTTAVVIVSVVCCALIAVLDYVFEYGMNFITSIF